MGEKKRSSFFVDVVDITVEGGKGGDGVVHFRREKYVPKGGPDGGDGGDGGNVYAIGNEHLKTLLDFTYKTYYKAGDGKPGGKRKSKGAKGKDVIIQVPLGTVFYDRENGSVIGEILRHGQKLLLARGGKGGRGNARFATPTNRTPRIREEGKKGERKRLRLELKYIADIGLVGFPNSGKSTLLRALTGNRVKSADYPFTTLTPNLGVYKNEKAEKIILCDLPGIIEGASKGKGLGLTFLRHIERTNYLIFVLDASKEDPVNDFEKLKEELRAYNPSLLEKERIVVFNKIDLIKSKDKLAIPGERVYYISALTGENVDQIREVIREWLKLKNLQEKTS